ncbi:MFS transporter [Streptomyces sp. ISL-12]|uniref:MFS transporter n=1 Tax=Streptomyces sp. ISL-12 TaxID=2819177 RepID=UPI001C14F1B4|nr:MFS transporter [Streptomyces sp. ISL-12]MBT2413304.1 MFS transporter [Streptomyces sp. ISL-12]
MPHELSQQTVRVSPIPVRPHRQVTRDRNAAVFLSVVLVTFLAASSAPTPLYHEYQMRWHLTSGAITLIYGAYCLSVLASLLTVGALSDHVGRRPVIWGSLALEALSMLLFLQADGMTSLVVARTLQGLATGAATSSLGAALLDVTERGGALFVSVAPLVGMASGTLVTSVLLDLWPARTGVVYAVLLAAMAAQVVGLLFVPEPGARRPGALRSLRPRVRTPRSTRPALMLTAPVFVAVWALGGFYLSLGPDLIQRVTGSSVSNGLIVSVLTACAVPAVLLTRQAAAERTALGGSLLVACGVGVTLVAVHIDSGAVLYSGTAIAGLGFGPAFQGGVRLVTATADATERAGLMAAVYTITYLAMCVPVLAAGILAGRYGLVRSTELFGLLVMGLSLAPLARLRKLIPERAS